tara:strand:+ start:2245 stop:3369 length:1125 start_codon:yes stop_codon:yes gene_type:complete
MSLKEDILNSILIQSTENEYISFSNSDDKFWIMPKKNIRTALSLYQPSSAKGNLFKKFLPYFYNSKIIQKLFNINNNNYALEVKLLNLLKSVLNIQNIEFSIFSGTPSVHQKITIQISSGRQILGYCKVTDKEEIKTIFRHEQQILCELNRTGVKQIPKCLYCGPLKEDIYLFVQNTVKTNSSQILHLWKKYHWDFLTHLHTQTSQTISFEETDFYKSIKLLDQNKNLLPVRQKEIITNALTCIIQKYDGKQVCFSSYHSDFTPWNMIVENDKLFVFDFEYAKRTYPPFLDRFHFFTQVGIYKKKWSEHKIFFEYKLKIRGDGDYIKDPDMDYLCYLVDVVSFYINRHKGDYNKDAETSLSIWLSLISLLSADE